MRRANGALNAAGMCCAITMAGQSAGSATSSSRIASVPPVEAPTAMMRSVVRSIRARRACGRQDGVGRMFGRTARRPTGALRARTRAPAATRILARISSLKSLQRSGEVDLGLGDEIDRAQLQRLERGLGAAFGQRRHHDHRHGPQAHEIGEESQSVHARHLDVQREHVRIGLLDALARHERIRRRAHHFDVPARSSGSRPGSGAPAPNRRRPAP